MRFIMNRFGNILTYQELLTVLPGENNEPLISLNSVCPDIICKYEKTDMIPLTGNDIYVRKTVAEKLCRVQERIKKISSEFQLRVVYGYRHPNIQKKYFNKKKQELLEKENISDENIDAVVHNFIAVPEVAGHPTGGALDLTIVKNGKMVDMGTEIADYSDEEKIKTYSINITSEQMKNRMILHDAMLSEKFAPFYGEWWHFSHGDREWAYFYGEEKSIYSPIFFEKK